MKRNRLFIPIGILIFLVLCLVPSGEAQTCVNFPQGAVPNWNIGMKCNFNASSTPVSFSSAGSVFWQILWGPAGTVSAATLSLDSSATGVSGSWSTGGILAAATIGSLASANTYNNTNATTPSNFAQLTPTITGSGSVTVVIFGYTTNPSTSGGGSGGTVTVSNFPATQPVSGTVSSDVQGHAGAAVDAAPGATAPAASFSVGATYNSSPQTPSSGSQEPLQIDANSNLNTDTQAIGGVPLSLYATLFNAQAATGTATSGAVRLQTQSTLGALQITGTGITGSPSGCQISLQPQANTGTPLGSAYATVSFTPANSYQNLPFLSSVAAADQVVATFTCGTYPTGGTISVALGTFSTAISLGVNSATQPSITSNAAGPEQIDSAGNTKITFGGNTQALTAWSSGTSVNATQSLLSNSGASAVVLQLDQTTTLTAGAVTIRCSFDNVNWIACPLVYNSSTGLLATNPYTVVASTNQPFLIYTQGAPYVQLLLSTAITGTGMVTPYVTIPPAIPYITSFLYGHSGNNLDTTPGGTLTSGILGVAIKTQASAANGAASATTKALQALADLTGQLYTIPGGSFRFSNAPVSISTNTTTQLVAAPAAGFTAYVTDLIFNVTTAGSATTLQIVYGTGTNCGTGTTALSVTIPNTTAGLQQIHMTEPLVPATAATAICVTQTGTTAGTQSVMVAGYVAP